MLRARADEGKKTIGLMCFFEELPVVGVGLVSRSFLVDLGCEVDKDRLCLSTRLYCLRTDRNPSMQTIWV